MNAISAIKLAGCGAVSAAGWGIAALRQAVATGTRAEISPLPAPAGSNAPPHHVCRVPAAPALEFLRHPRLRRTSPVSWFAAAAAMEARAAASSDPAAPPVRCGLVFAVMNACVQYSSRFFSEVLRDPSTASPLIFPETVFNAPASHLAVLCGIDGAVTTLVGGRTAFIDGVRQAAEWLADDLVDECLVVSSEEADWLTAAGLALLRPGLPGGEGAGALLLRRGGPGPVLSLHHSPQAEIVIPCDALHAAAGECMGAAAALQAALAAGMALDATAKSVSILTREFHARTSAGLTFTTPHSV